MKSKLPSLDSNIFGRCIRRMFGTKTGFAVTSVACLVGINVVTGGSPLVLAAIAGVGAIGINAYIISDLKAFKKTYPKLEEQLTKTLKEDELKKIHEEVGTLNGNLKLADLGIKSSMAGLVVPIVNGVVTVLQQQESVEQRSLGLGITSAVTQTAGTGAAFCSLFMYKAAATNEAKLRNRLPEVKDIPPASLVVTTIQQLLK